MPTSSTNGAENTESITITDNRSVSHPKSSNTSNRPPLSNGTHSIPPTPVTIKSSVSTNLTPPKKNGEARHTLLSREPVSIPIERVAAVTNTQTADSEVVELNDKTAKTNGTKDPTDRRHRSRTLEAHQIKAVDNQIYGCPSKTKQQTQHRSESHKHRTNRLIVRRSSEDTQDKKSQLRKSKDYHSQSTHDDGSDETWFDIDKEHWMNLLENGWRPTAGTTGVTSVAIANSEHSRERKSTKTNSKVVDLYDQISKAEYTSLFDQLEFAYTRTINLGNEFWRFLEIDGHHHLCLYHQLNKQFIMYKPDETLLCFPWPYDGIVDVSWSKSTNTWAVATQTQIVRNKLSSENRSQLFYIFCLDYLQPII